MVRKATITIYLVEESVEKTKKELELNIRLKAKRKDTAISERT